MDNFEAPYIGDPDYGETAPPTQEDYAYYWQDDDRKENEIQKLLEENT